ncbi:MAG: EAL domain-containing protein [Thiobacillus sp.]|nr:EAL domain-containing protein [Thiobacillus sp.]
MPDSLNRELTLQVLLDLAFTIGGELSLPVLQRKTLQRFMFHTGFPVGLMLARHADGVLVDVAIGDHRWLAKQGTAVMLPTGLLGDEARLVEDEAMLAGIGTGKKMRAALVLPVPEYGWLLLLTPGSMNGRLPLTAMFQPVLARLGNAVTLCQGYERGLQRKLLSSLVATIPDLIWVKDPDGVYLACNPRFEQLYGASAADIVGKTDADFVDPEQAAAFRANDLAALAADAPRINEEWLTFATGGYRGLFETIKSPMRDPDGNLLGVLGVAREITGRKQTEERLRLAAGVFAAAEEGIIITDTDGVILDANAAFMRMSGFALDELVGQTTRLIKSTRHEPEQYRDLWEALAHNGVWHGELWNRRKDGELFAAHISISAVKDPEGGRGRYVALFTDVTDQKRQQDRIEKMAYHDVLTQLPNRALLADRMSQALAGAQRHGSRIAVCYLDLDGFKPVNDRYGHQAGDALLVEVSRRILGALRGQDTAARLGGDEFVLLLTEMSANTEYQAVLARVAEAIGRPYKVPGGSVQLSVSMGVTVYPADDSDPDTLLRHADQAMYAAKQGGRSQIRYYDPFQDLALRERVEARERVREWLRDDCFRLYWQPMVDLRLGRVVGAEALIRCLPPDGRLVMPGDFLPEIEDDDLIVELGDWVIETAVRQLSEWHAQGLKLLGSINVAARQLHTDGFAERLFASLARYPNVEPGQIELEILETAALDDVARVNDLIGRCRERGIRFALDDFGTGYASMTYFRRLAIDTVKVDQSFIRNMLDDGEDQAIVAGILGLTSAFGKLAVAEGVESVEHGSVLLRMGCPIAQGYAIARPMPAERLPAWVARYAPHPAWAAVLSGG